MLNVGEKVDYVSFLGWCTDYRGDEVGYPDVNIVGLYSDNQGNDYYLNTEDGTVLEVLESSDD